MYLALGTRKISNPANLQTIDEPFECERLFTELASRLEANPRIRRVLGRYDANSQMERAFDFELQVANQDLAIYLDVNESTNSIVQDRPCGPTSKVALACGRRAPNWASTVWATPSKPSSTSRRVTSRRR